MSNKGGKGKYKKKNVHSESQVDTLLSEADVFKTRSKLLSSPSREEGAVGGVSNYETPQNENPGYQEVQKDKFRVVPAKISLDYSADQVPSDKVDIIDNLFTKSETNDNTSININPPTLNYEPPSDVGNNNLNTPKPIKLTRAVLDEFDVKNQSDPLYENVHKNTFLGRSKNVFSHNLPISECDDVSEHSSDPCVQKLKYQELENRVTNFLDSMSKEGGRVVNEYNQEKMINKNKKRGSKEIFRYDSRGPGAFGYVNQYDYQMGNKGANFSTWGKSNKKSGQGRQFLTQDRHDRTEDSHKISQGRHFGAPQDYQGLMTDMQTGQGRQFVPQDRHGLDRHITPDRSHQMSQNRHFGAAPDYQGLMTYAQTSQTGHGRQFVPQDRHGFDRQFPPYVGHKMSQERHFGASPDYQGLMTYAQTSQTGQGRQFVPQDRHGFDRHIPLGHKISQGKHFGASQDYHGLMTHRQGPATYQGRQFVPQDRQNFDSYISTSMGHQIGQNMHFGAVQDYQDLISSDHDRSKLQTSQGRQFVAQDRQRFLVDSDDHSRQSGQDRHSYVSRDHDRHIRQQTFLDGNFKNDNRLEEISRAPYLITNVDRPNREFGHKKLAHATDQNVLKVGPEVLALNQGMERLWDNSQIERGNFLASGVQTQLPVHQQSQLHFNSPMKGYFQPQVKWGGDPRQMDYSAMLPGEGSPSSASGSPQYDRIPSVPFNTPVAPLAGTSRPVVRSLPKNLTFSGSESWTTFKYKFRLFLKQNQIVDEDTGIFYLTMALSGSAGDFLSRMSESTPFTSLNQTLQILEERYSDVKLSQSALVEFQTVAQRPGEPIKAWGQRVWLLAFQAYPTLSASEIERLAVLRFCLALTDKTAARHLACQQFKNMSEAEKAYDIFTYAQRATTSDLEPKQTHIHSSKADKYPSIRAVLEGNDLAYLKEIDPAIRAISDKDFEAVKNNSNNNRSQIDFLKNWVKRLADRVYEGSKLEGSKIHDKSNMTGENDGRGDKQAASSEKRHFRTPNKPDSTVRERGRSPVDRDFQGAYKRYLSENHPSSYRSLAKNPKLLCFLCKSSEHLAAKCPLKETHKINQADFGDPLTDISEYSDNEPSPKDLGLDE